MRLFFLATLSSLILLLTQSCSEKLPYLGQKEYNPDTKDSVEHQVQEFAFINQDNEIITQEYLDNKVTVVSFFFTSCPSICPIMTDQLKRLQKITDVMYDIQILTHTVDPERDSVERLAAYIKKKNIDTKNWNFVTGNKQMIYESGVFNYMLAAQEDVLAPGGFLHSDQFVLIDKNRHVRGAYDGTSESEVNKLIKDLKILFNEYN